MKKSENYGEIPPAIAVNVLGFKLLPFEKPFSMYTLREEENFHRLTDAIQLYFLEVPKLIKKPVDEMPLMEKWLGFCSPKFSMKEKEEIAMTEPSIKDALDAAEIFFMDDERYQEYFARESAIRDYEFGLNSARKEGEKEGEKKGKKKGEDKLLRLIDALYSAGKQNYISKLCADKNFRENLYKEFDIA